MIETDPGLADWVRAEFWQLQIPMTILVAPPGEQGVTALSDFGERVHFPDRTAVSFFLLGYRTGQNQPPLEEPQLGDATPEQEAE